MVKTKQLIIELPTEIADQLEQKAAEAKLPLQVIVGGQQPPMRYARCPASTKESLGWVRSNSARPMGLRGRSAGTE
jgi:hypothetical protein